ncbi:lamin tail domain-containing protein, partial [bacterium]|nr:lamin tail domain-containing protein [bacterium]
MRFLEVVKISLLVLFSAPVSAGVVLSEIMFDPLEDEDTDEFVELYNDSSLPVNLAGWVVSDGDGSDTLVDAGFGMMAAPRQFILILDPDYIEEASTTYDSLVPENALVVIIVGSTFGSRGFSNGDSEQISLVNANGQTVATRAYSTGNTPGHSDEKRVMNGGDDDENWMDCETLHGTPGFRNSVTPLERNLGIVEIEADPDAPAAGSSFSISVSVVNSGL